MRYRDVLNMIKRGEYDGAVWLGGDPYAPLGQQVASSWMTPDRPGAGTFTKQVAKQIVKTPAQQHLRNGATAAVTAPLSLVNGFLSISTSLANLAGKVMSKGTQAVGIDPNTYDPQKGIQQVTKAMHDAVKWIPQQVADKVGSQPQVYKGTMNTGTFLTQLTATPSLAAGAIESKAATKALPLLQKGVAQLPQRMQSGIVAASPALQKGTEKVTDAMISNYAPIH